MICCVPCSQVKESKSVYTPGLYLIACKIHMFLTITVSVTTTATTTRAKRGADFSPRRRRRRRGYRHDRAVRAAAGRTTRSQGSTSARGL